jgi:hypothetical protein
MMKWKFVRFIWTVGALIINGCSTRARSVTSISLDFPHGGLRLLVQRDDEARLFYGALPASRSIPESTFDIDEIFDQLQPRLHKVVPAENRPLGQDYGIASIRFNDGSSKDYLIYDENYATDLFKKACQHSAAEENSSSSIFERECAALDK